MQVPFKKTLRKALLDISAIAKTNLYTVKV